MQMHLFGKSIYTQNPDNYHQTHLSRKSIASNAFINYPRIYSPKSLNPLSVILEYPAKRETQRFWLVACYPKLYTPTTFIAQLYIPLVAATALNFANSACNSSNGLPKPHSRIAKFGLKTIRKNL